MTPREQNLTFLLKKTIADMVSGEVKTDRQTIFDALAEHYEQTGAKSFSITLPDGERAATLTIAEPKPRDYVNEEQLIEWLENNGHDDLIYTTKKLKKGALDSMNLAVTEDGEYVTEDGEVVEGITKQPATAPTSFTVRYEKGAQDKVIEAWRTGQLAGITPGDHLPAIGTTTQDETPPTESE